MDAPVFILPTSGPRTYRGKYPNRPRSISAGETGLHLELNSGVRLWSFPTGRDTLPKLADDCSALLRRAVPMTAEQYATLKAAAELLRTRAGYAGRGPRARIEARVRAMVESIKPDGSQYAKRNAEAARRKTLAGETGRGFDPARPFRVRNKTPQFSGSFDFATLAEARDYLAGQVARRACVVSGAAPVGPDSDSQCQMQSFIIWADGSETLADMGWTPPAEGERRWNPPATVEPTEAAAREAADEMGFGVETVSASPVMIGTAETTEAPAPVRRDNVEYHAGRAAFAAGVPLADCPYLAGGERAARWTLGWQEADNRPHVVASRSVDGAEYLTGMGWSGDYRAALVMSPADAREIAAREETKAAATRSPDNGTYQIKAHVWNGPRLYTVAEYESDEAARLDSLYGAA